MRIEQLNLFLTLLSSGSMTNAGRLLHLSQPAVTASLKALEEEIGQQLLTRTAGQRQPLRPTPAGEIFSDYARRSLAEYQAMLSTVAQAAGNLYAPIRIGVTPTPGSSLLPVLNNYFKSENPKISIHVKTYHGIEIVPRLKNSEFDVGITGLKPQHDGIIFDRFFYDPLVLIAPASMGITGPITLRRLKKLPLIIRDSSGNLTQLLVRALKRVGLSFESMNVIMQVSGNNDVLSSVTLGAGVGFVARSLLAANRENKNIVVVPVRRLQVDRYVYMIRRESTPFTGALRLFWQYALSPIWREKTFAFNTMDV